MHTKDILAAELTKAGLHEMAATAAAGRYHDFLSPLDFPGMQLASDLKAAGTPAALALLARHMNGEFDASGEESEAWGNSPEGRETFGKFVSANRAERRRAGERGSKKRAAEGLGDAPIQDAYRETMNRVAGALDEIFNGDARGAERETGFVLLVFPFGEAEAGRCNFISNGADRKDVVSLMKEMIARFEGQPEVSGRA